MTSSNVKVLRVTGPITGGFPSQGPVTRGFDNFFDVRLNNGWANSRYADLRRHGAHYDVTVMI